MHRERVTTTTDLAKTSITYKHNHCLVKLPIHTQIRAIFRIRKLDFLRQHKILIIPLIDKIN